MSNRHIVDRKLPDRARLTFFFPVPTMGNEYYVVNIPFFENVVIQEKKKARYQKYSLISRSSNLYSYLGADSRQLNLSFSMTLPHILEEHPEINLDTYMPYDLDKSNIEEEKAKFKNPHGTDKKPKGMAFTLGTKYTKELAHDTAKTFLMNAKISKSLSEADEHMIQSRYGITEGEMFNLDYQANLELIGIENFTTKVISNVLAAKSSLLDIENNEDLEHRYQVIDIIIYWINLIRASVVNYPKNPIYGPPIIRLRHGILYQNIPCICTNYSIDFNEAAGYDLNTLLPRQLKINMKLEEIRTGDFGEFDPNDENNPIKRDNLAGWEAVVLEDSHSMDPGYGGLF